MSPVLDGLACRSLVFLSDPLVSAWMNYRSEPKILEKIFLSDFT